MFERVEDMMATPRIRRPKAIHTADQIIGQVSRLGFTVGITSEDASLHQKSMCTPPAGKYHAMAVSPLANGRLNPPDVCLISANPAHMILLINGLRYPIPAYGVQMDVREGMSASY